MQELITSETAEAEQQKIPVTAIVRLKHGILHALNKKLGSQAAVAEELGVSQQEFCAWVNFRRRPSNRWTKERSVAFAAQIFELTGHTVDEIWPEWLDSVLGMTTADERTVQMNSHQCRRLMSSGGTVNIEWSKDDLRESLDSALKCLTHRQRQTLKMRFGLGDGTRHTYAEIGHAFEVTPERVREIERQAIRTLQRHRSAAPLARFIESGGA